VYDKEGCWSSNHLKEEREESRKKFRAKFNRRFDTYARQYIADYEGVDDATDDADSINEAIKALIVIDTDADTDAEQTDFEAAEHFVTSFRALESQRAFDITTTLANHSLTHALTCANTASNPTTTLNSDLFAYTATSRYTADQFYSIMIDTGVLKRLIAGYSQYLAY
jgi:hypothetical protein